MYSTTDNESRITDHELGIYIHWPYCLSKCPYCDFFSEVKKADEDQIINDYLEDLNFYRDLTSNHTVASIFFGGGTPSLIKPQNLEKLITHIRQKWKTTKNLEITLEANPNTFSDHKSQITDHYAAGINRLSLGVQALNVQALKFLGRTHTLTQALTSIDEVLKTFDNHSMDLIYARPGQRLEDWQKELEQASAFGFKHLSLYQLTIEEGTPFYKQGIEALNEEEAADMYLFTEDFLKPKGYHKYEVSNFAQLGFESEHNLGYWQGRDYLGIGPSAHGRITLTSPLAGEATPLSEVVRGAAYPEKNTPITLATTGLNHTDYRLQVTDHYTLEPLTPQEHAAELLLMGLRLTSGINKKSFQSHCGLELNSFINQQNLEELKTQNLITETPTHLKATPQGFLLLNKIIEQLILTGTI